MVWSVSFSGRDQAVQINGLSCGKGVIGKRKKFVINVFNALSRCIFVAALAVCTGGFRVQPGGLNRRSGRSDLGSLPDLTTVRHLPVVAPIPRNEAMLLCQRKREELQFILEEEQQKRRHTIVVRLGDFKVCLAGCLRPN